MNTKLFIPCIFALLFFNCSNENINEEREKKSKKELNNIDASVVIDTTYSYYILMESETTERIQKYLTEYDSRHRGMLKDYVCVSNIGRWKVISLREKNDFSEFVDLYGFLDYESHRNRADEVIGLAFHKEKASYSYYMFLDYNSDLNDVVSAYMDEKGAFGISLVEAVNNPPRSIFTSEDITLSKSVTEFLEERGLTEEDLLKSKNVCQ